MLVASQANLVLDQFRRPPDDDDEKSIRCLLSLALCALECGAFLLQLLLLFSFVASVWMEKFLSFPSTKVLLLRCCFVGAHFFARENEIGSVVLYLLTYLSAKISLFFFRRKKKASAGFVLAATAFSF